MSMNVSGEVVRNLRLQRGWTQEHLATLCETSVKTIQRVESKGICGIETRSALAAVLQIDVKQLDGAEAIQQAKNTKDKEPLFYRRLLNGTDVINVFQDSYWYRFSTEDAKSEEDSDLMASSVQDIQDWSEIWGDIDAGSKTKAKFNLGELLKELESKGMWVFGLRTKTTIKAPHRDGTTSDIVGPCCNIHIAYANSESVIVLNPT